MTGGQFRVIHGGRSDDPTPGLLVVGASAAGLATVEALRRKGYQGSVTVLGAERHLPYDRPPLSKEVLSGGWSPERAQLRTPDALSALDAEFVLGDPAAGLDLATRTVHTTAGRELTADAVVVACDSMLRLGKSLLGKPVTVDRARLYWDQMAGRTGTLLTGHAVVRIVDGTTVASSRDSHATSSTSRCCGSMRAASRGEIPKKRASKRSTSSRNAP